MLIVVKKIKKSNEVYFTKGYTVHLQYYEQPKISKLHNFISKKKYRVAKKSAVLNDTFVWWRILSARVAQKPESLVSY